jgi:hypothetical protein
MSMKLYISDLVLTRSLMQECIVANKEDARQGVSRSTIKKVSSPDLTTVVEAD